MAGLLPVFDKYFNKEDADFYIALLADAGLHPLSEPAKPRYDAIIGYAQTNDHFIIRLPGTEFAAANALIVTEVQRQGIPEDHYLRTYNTVELNQLLLDSNEWSREDAAVAEILLKERSVVIDKAFIAASKETQRKKAEQKIPVPVLVLLYIIAPLGALFSMVAGIIIHTITDYDLEGKKYYVYTANIRRHGLILFIIGVASTICWILFRDTMLGLVSLNLHL